MNLRIPQTLLLSAFLLSSSLTTTLWWETPVYAAAQTATDLKDLQAKLEAAIFSKPASFSVTYTGGALSKTSMNAILAAIYEKDDYLLYSTKSYGYTLSPDKDSSTINLTFTYWETEDQSKDVAARVSDILSEIITPDMNDFQKEKAIHDWIISNLAYDTSLVQHSAYAGLFGNRKTVCQGYALLAYRMLSDAGLENKIIEGTAGGQLHTWNLVKLEGNWYHLDTTWDDPVPDTAGRLAYGYYNLTDAQIKSNHTWKKKYPAATVDFNTTLLSKENTDTARADFYQKLQQSLDLDYIKDEYTISTPAQLATKIKETMATNQPSFTARYTGKKSIANDLKSAISSFGNISAYSYSSPDYMRTALATDILLTVNLTYGDSVSAAGITLNNTSLTVNAGSTAPLVATIQPMNVSNKGITWSSSNSAIATVSNKGVVSGKSSGTAIITATTTDGGLTAAAEVNVIQPVTRISLGKTALNLKVGDPDFTLTPTIAPTNATNKDITWSSSNTSVATVDEDGNVHILASGKAAISAKSQNGKTASVTLSIKP
ncbi:Ig-like domain-containing protein [Paenibacillus sp. WQ 127069]|uniref:Ig-like domain-containing protein n=1 Tax=Paenibacillus baimaensis TaxID=2982185 RepID=A0ABT2UEP8_9BACL|nr:Ig-like domain-containing protein [Paenibacillus sp. WQ 127069]MCU6792114.1 Ig-like domain-containing protein [Paenibacillus sp. WQ 127069]